MFFTPPELRSVILQLQHDSVTAEIIPRKSGEGVFSRRYLNNELKKFIENGQARITISKLSKNLDVDDKYISSVLSTLEDGEQLFITLEDDLKEQLEDGVVTVVKYCRENDISKDTLIKLGRFLERKWSIELDWKDGDRYIYRPALVDELVDEITAELNEAVEPVRVRDVPFLGGGEYPDYFTDQLEKQVRKDKSLAGFWEKDQFIPMVYKLKKQEEVRQELRKIGFIHYNKYNAAYIGGKSDTWFTENFPGGEYLGDHYFSKDWLDAFEKQAQDSLEITGYADFEILASGLKGKEPGALLSRFHGKRKKGVRKYMNTLITDDVREKMKRTLLDYGRDLAEKDWKARSTKLLDNLRTYGDLCPQFEREYPGLGSGPITKIINDFERETRKTYDGRRSTLRETANTAEMLAFAEGFYLRFVINLRAVIRVKDAGLQDKLAQDLLAYYRKIIQDGLANYIDGGLISTGGDLIEEVKQRTESINNILDSGTPTKAIDTLQTVQEALRGYIQKIWREEPTDEVVAAKQVEMQTELKAQLAKTTNVSLIMLVVLILLFSKLEDGILRATGKYAPKILRALKAGMTEEDYEFLESVKAAVIAGSTPSEEDIEKLRAMGMSIS
ncbi:hypothetical protein H072_9602 [Dactylellina haptotyla CBS 200.50]|uniref:Uncharacterized protein n=1 Tax=Dactylellina haptotyla (strain CBS 200.50) TaxID=1284197 RepID=S8BNC7_DACHA|nr:hypothetical protein H072_9602 [Dactylellina haptotyla CBS 200.50]